MPFIIDDSTPDQALQSQGLCGSLPRREAYGALPFATAFTLPVIPREQWPDLIADKLRTKSTLKHVWADSGLGVLSQNPLNYCHVFSAIMGVMIQREVQGLPRIELSAGSVGGPATGYRNIGWYVSDIIRQLSEVGACPTSLIPMHQVAKSGFPPGWEKVAEDYKVTEWWDVQPRNFDQHATLLLSDQPCPVGLNYWGHAVLDLVLVDYNPSLPATDLNRYGVDFLNSWGKTWGDSGWGTRVGSKKFLDDGYSIRQLTA